MEEALKPCDSRAIVGHLARLANHFRSERPEAAWSMLFEDYAVDLAGISETHLQATVEKSRRSKPWFPKVADLLALWAVEREADRERLRRARVLLGKEEPKHWEKVSNLSPDAASDSPRRVLPFARVGQPRPAYESVAPSLALSHGEAAAHG